MIDKNGLFYGQPFHPESNEWLTTRLTCISLAVSAIKYRWPTISVSCTMILSKANVHPQSSNLFLTFGGPPRLTLHGPCLSHSPRSNICQTKAESGDQHERPKHVSGGSHLGLFGKLMSEFEKWQGKLAHSISHNENNHNVIFAKAYPCTRHEDCPDWGQCRCLYPLSSTWKASQGVLLLSENVLGYWRC